MTTTANNNKIKLSVCQSLAKENAKSSALCLAPARTHTHPIQTFTCTFILVSCNLGFVCLQCVKLNKIWKNAMHTRRCGTLVWMEKQSIVVWHLWRFHSKMEINTNHMSNVFGKFTFRIELAFGSCSVFYTFAHKMYDDYFVIMLYFDWHEMHPETSTTRNDTYSQYALQCMRRNRALLMRHLFYMWICYCCFRSVQLYST